MRIFFTCTVLLLVSFFAEASPKYEFRGAWIATIGGIDWPSPNSRKDQNLVRQEYINLLDELERDGLNAVVVQVRPAADAFYESTYEPYSKYLTGTQGLAPQPYYDVLKFLIDEAHSRGMEFHAWFNPYRALVDASKNPNPPNHVTYQNPSWFVNYDGKKYFNPGVPQVRKYVQSVVMEVVNKYNIDAVHFDDYFYPYKVPGKEFADQSAFYMYGGGFLSKDDWRRNNVNLFVQEMSAEIKRAKPNVKLGISPFGVWRNASKDPEGSNTQGGQTNYDDLYADILLWLKNKWIDYVLPQLYWEQSHKKVGFNVLLDWWANHTYGRALYIGHGLYRVANDKAAAWHQPQELQQQVYSVRSNTLAQGSCFYSANYFLKDKLGVITTMRNDYYRNKAIPPTMPWLDAVPPSAPKIISQKKSNGFIQLSLQQTSPDAEYFCVYRFNKNERKDLNNAEAIIKRTSQKEISLALVSNSVYLITAEDKVHNESNYIQVSE